MFKIPDSLSCSLKTQIFSSNLFRMFLCDYNLDISSSKMNAKQSKTGTMPKEILQY